MVFVFLFHKEIFNSRENQHSITFSFPPVYSELNFLFKKKKENAFLSSAHK